MGTPAKPARNVGRGGGCRVEEDYWPEMVPAMTTACDWVTIIFISTTPLGGKHRWSHYQQFLSKEFHDKNISNRQNRATRERIRNQKCSV